MADQKVVSERHQQTVRQALLTVSGGLILFLGAILAFAGLTFVGYSSYHALAGSGLVLAGTLIARRKQAGAWVFMTVFAATLVWSLPGLEAGVTSLTMWLVGPTILLGMIALVMPTLRGWRAGRTIAAFLAVFAGTVGVGIASAADPPPAWPATEIAG